MSRVLCRQVSGYNLDYNRCAEYNGAMFVELVETAEDTSHDAP
jgi:hypothetical protein